MHLGSLESTQEAVDITAFLGFKRPPFLSMHGFKGQLKSPFIIMFSSSSRLFFCSVTSKLLKKLTIFASLLGAWINQNMSAFTITNCPKGAKHF